MAASMRSSAESQAGPLKGRSLVLVGNPDAEHVGAHLRLAAEALRLRVDLCDTKQAFVGPAWRTRFNWWLRGHRPSQLRAFSRRVVELCRERRPDWLLSTGLAPIDAEALESIGALGVRRLNFLTDDPWNPAHRAQWFSAALPHYDHVFTPRRANTGMLRSLGGPRVDYLPFAYAPAAHFPELPEDATEQGRFAADVVFAGGADRDRVTYVAALIGAGFRVDLYGGYWDRFPETRPRALGFAGPRTLRKAIGGASIALCLVRRANRDGHVMRSFEIPAMRGYMLAEDTDDHRDFFGPDGQTVTFFTDAEQLVTRVQGALAEAAEMRHERARRAHEHIVGGENTYQDRLRTMLLIGSSPDV